MAPKTIRWGMMATGGIVRTMTRDLLIDPKTRGVNDIIHQISAAASSSSKQSAENFVNTCVAPFQDPATPCRAYGSYEELVRDPDVDIIYVGTPHSHHFQNCMLAFTHNKPVLCEKPLTVNAAQACLLAEEARKRGLFFMEAAWTRFFPLSISVREKIAQGAVGEVLRIAADLSTGEAPEMYDEGHRNVNMDLAGGALLDLGVYSLMWVFQAARQTLPAEKRQRPRVVGSLTTPEPRTGADESTTVLLDFPSTPEGNRNLHAVATTAMRVHFDHGRESESATPAVRIQGDKGEIQVFGPIYRPQRFRVLYADKAKPIEVYQFDFPGGTHGMSWEGDEAARCVAQGKKESPDMPLDETIAIMEVMDEVRKQNDLKYPDVIESTEYPLDLKKRDPNQKRDFTSPIVSIAVGPEERAFYVHEAVLHANSRCFEAALSKTWADGQEKALSFCEESPEVFNLSVKYSSSSSSSVRQTSAFDESYDILACMYALGARLSDQAFRDKILGAMVDTACAYAKRNTPSGWGSAGLPSGKAVNSIYNATTEGLSGRRLMVDIYATFGNPDWAAFRGGFWEVEKPHPEFTLDLVKALLEKRAIAADKSQGLARSAFSKDHCDADEQA